MILGYGWSSQGNRSIKFFCLVVLSIATIGCGSSGPATGEVTGKVTIDGQPIEGASIEFIPADGRPSTGVTDASGAYELMFTNDAKGALLGSHQVRITTARAGDGGEGVGPTLEARDELLPAKYHDESELTAEVVAGKNTFDFDLQTK